MDDLNPELAPYAITAAWRISDFDTGYQIASHTLRRFYIQPGFYELKDHDEARAMKEAVGNERSKRAPACMGRCPAIGLVAVPEE